MRFINSSRLGEASKFSSKQAMTETARTEPPPPPARAGRPTRDQARARHAALLDRALAHFLEKGFETTTIEAIAADVSMTKRTVYARYADKAALFRAAVERGTRQLAAPAETIAATRRGDLQGTLIAIAMLRIALVSTPDGMRLQRLVNTESYRFPDIFQTYYAIAAFPTVRFLADILESETTAGRLAIDDPLLAANVFMSMVVSGPVRIILSGNALPPAEIDQRVRFAVRLFLKGAEPR